jgi:multimeric flavodoxin WrbA
MKKKVIGVISSPKYNGNTATLVKEALKGAAEEGAEVEEIFLPQYTIKFCTGCLKCQAEGKCPISDDFSALKQRLDEADGVILGSPTYEASPNAMMKRFSERFGLFERMTSEVFGGKYVVGISTCGGAGAKGVANDLAKSVESSVFQRGYTSGTLGVALGPNSIAEDTKSLHQARELGKKIVRDIQRGATYPLQNILGRIVNTMFIKPGYLKVIQKNKDGKMKSVYTTLERLGRL